MDSSTFYLDDCDEVGAIFTRRNEGSTNHLDDVFNIRRVEANEEGNEGLTDVEWQAILNRIDAAFQTPFTAEELEAAARVVA